MPLKNKPVDPYCNAQWRGGRPPGAMLFGEEEMLHTQPLSETDTGCTGETVPGERIPSCAHRPGARQMTATVPRQLVHRAAVAETFLTGWTPLGEDRFSVTAQWPRAHTFYLSPDGTAYDLLLAVETVRQSGALLAHAEYGVPLGHQFVLQELSITTYPEQLSVGTAPADIVMDIACLEVRRKGRTVAGLRCAAIVRRGGEIAARAEIGFTCISEPVYRRLRGGRTAASVSVLPVPPALPAATVRRGAGVDVALSPTDRPDRWQLRVDTGHPVLFDHPLDHVPGVLLLEAAAQAVRVGTNGRSLTPVSFGMAFHRYAELDTPTWIQAMSATPSGDGTSVRIVGTQDDRIVFDGVVGTIAA